MRFKMRIRVEKVPHLLRIAQALERVGKLAVLHLFPVENGGTRLVVQPDVEGSVAVYASIKMKHWFEGYRIESQNGNQIGLEMDLQNLIRALRSAAAADEITVKLAKKGVPVLTFDIATPLGPILQDVPVSVLSAARLAECVEPVIESVCGFTLPTLTRLHAFIERMRGLGNRIELLATVGERHSELCVQMLTDNVSVATSYQKLARAGMVGDEESVSELEVEKFSASVDLRNLRCALFGHQLAPKHALCFILKTCVMVHLMGDGDGSADVSYYIPKFFD